jgi:hypothetical protein|tara:strand:+ start:376 stop:1584 length:1209 start_codon:yes stop_codon:yes gene_type:complete
MSSNDRIFYACQSVGIQAHGADAVVTTGQMIHGLQSVGMTTNFNLEQAFELGQIEIYENIEGTPDVEMTLEKVLDGYPLIYHMASVDGLDGSPGGSGLVGRSKSRSDVRLGIFPDNKNNVSAGDANAEAEVYCSGMYISSVSYTIPTDGSMTESVTLVGNNKQWLTGGQKITAAAVNNFDGTDSPAAKNTPDGVAVLMSGGIQQREDVLMSGCILPNSIKGVTLDGGYSNAFDAANGINNVHLQSFSCSTDFSREDILELGRKTPYARPAAFPIEVSCEIEAVTTSGDFVNAFEFGDERLAATDASGNNTEEEDIFICTRAGYAFDLGRKNRLSSVSYGGGDAGGGNATCTYSYTNFNELDVQNLSQNGYVGFEVLKDLTGSDMTFTGTFPTGALYGSTAAS